jgi:5-methylcytosine-specific restriction endonuclease McrA
LRDNYRQLIQGFYTLRREMAESDFVCFRGELGGSTTFLRLRVLVPVCPDCWSLDPTATSAVPNIMADNWELDLILLGFHPDVIAELRADVSEGIGEERGPWCHECGTWLPWWEEEGGCFTKEVDFADYFGFREKENPAVSKEMRKRIIKMYGRKCFACGRKLATNGITIDHIVARSKGGTGDQINLQLLCKNCNNAKSNTQVQQKEAILHFPVRPVPSDAYEGVTW